MVCKKKDKKKSVNGERTLRKTKKVTDFFNIYIGNTLD